MFFSDTAQNHEHLENMARDCKTSSEAKIAEASLWLAANYDVISGNLLLALITRYGLSALDAALASKRAHALRYGGTRG